MHGIGPESIVAIAIGVAILYSLATAASAARDAKYSEGALKAYKLAANTTIYAGTLVGTNSDGYLVSMLHSTASLKFAGVAIEGGTCGAVAGAVSVRVRPEGEYEFAYEGGDAAQALVGSVVYALDNQTVDEDASLTTNDYPVGKITEIISVTKVRVNIGGFVDLTQTIVTANLAANILTADAAGRGKMADDYFTPAELVAGAGGKFAPGAFDATGCANVFAAQAIPVAKVAKRVVEAHAADDLLTAAESGSVHVSNQAGAATVLTLPPAVEGLEYYFKVGTAQECRIDPDGAETIALPSTGVQGAAGKYLTANAIGETVHLLCDVAGTWSVYGYTGTWTAEG